MNEEIRHLLARQEGVIARGQALAAGVEPHEIRRLLRRREWVHLSRGVYVDQGGRLSSHQRAWAAVLSAWPAALWGRSALDSLEPAAGCAGAPIHIAVDRHRSGLRPPPGVIVHHVQGLAARAQWNASPPRMRLEDAVIDAAVTARSEQDAVAVLTRWVQRRRTTPDRLLDALGRRTRVRRRQWLVKVLTDVAAGTCSVLEHGYLTRVENPHRLPRAERQKPVRSSQGLVYRDASYGRLLVELDGRLFHDSASARHTDLERDLDAAVDGHTSVRLGWAQVFERPCSTAAKLVAVMERLGVSVQAQPCGSACAVGSPAPCSGVTG